MACLAYIDEDHRATTDRQWNPADVGGGSTSLVTTTSAWKTRIPQPVAFCHTCYGSGCWYGDCCGGSEQRDDEQEGILSHRWPVDEELP